MKSSDNIWARWTGTGFLLALFVIHMIWLRGTGCMITCDGLEHPPYPEWILIFTQSQPYLIALALGSVLLITHTMRWALLLILCLLLPVACNAAFWPITGFVALAGYTVMPWALVVLLLDFPCLDRIYQKWPIVVPLAELSFFLLFQWEIFTFVFYMTSDFLITEAAFQSSSPQSFPPAARTVAWPTFWTLAILAPVSTLVAFSQRTPLRKLIPGLRGRA